MKNLLFLGTTLDVIREFNDDIKRETGYQLHLVQMGEMPTDFKTMPNIGSGVVEIRLKDKDGIYRVIYTAKFANTVYVLHAFTKKTQKTPKADINLAKTCLMALIKQIQSN